MIFDIGQLGAFFITLQTGLAAAAAAAAAADTTATWYH
jgi:hypothetical protein